MDESQFHELVDTLLEELLDAIEEADEEGQVDVDLSNGVLTIRLPDDGEMVINKHVASSQVWLAAPISGASRFVYDDAEDEWRSTNGDDFYDLVTEELAQAGVELSL